MKIFWVKTQKSVVGNCEEATIVLQIYVFENKRKIFGFWLYCQKKFVLRQKQKMFSSSVLRQTFWSCGPLVIKLKDK